MSERLTAEREAEMRAVASHDMDSIDRMVLSLLDELDAVRAQRDAQRERAHAERDCANEWAKGWAEQQRTLAAVRDWATDDTAYVEGEDTPVNRSLNAAYARARVHVRALLAATDQETQ